MAIRGRITAAVLNKRDEKTGGALVDVILVRPSKIVGYA
jgi:hypothetical protein